MPSIFTMLIFHLNIVRNKANTEKIETFDMQLDLCECVAIKIRMWRCAQSFRTPRYYGLIAPQVLLALFQLLYIDETGDSDAPFVLSMATIFVRHALYS